MDEYLRVAAELDRAAELMTSVARVLVWFDACGHVWKGPRYEATRSVAASLRGAVFVARNELLAEAGAQRVAASRAMIATPVERVTHGRFR
ncbi:MAG: hypothetical protein GY708_17130 [Actinomycetia bacterium]|nr:hypothetical protein [Actinomycetes bacterium]MCP4962929.1 hypothetical protein [Actinomycetes bacterium]